MIFIKNPPLTSHNNYINEEEPANRSALSELRRKLGSDLHIDFDLSVRSQDAIKEERKFI